jgi:hypothetical protein
LIDTNGARQQPFNTADSTGLQAFESLCLKKTIQARKQAIYSTLEYQTKALFGTPTQKEIML